MPRTFLVVAGLYLVISGGVGFALDSSFPTSAAEAREHSAHIFGIFETNGWHNLAAVGVGLPALVVALVRPQLSAVAAIVAGAFNAMTFVLFLVIEPTTVWVASNAADQVVHSSLGVAGIAAGLYAWQGRGGDHRGGRAPRSRRAGVSMASR